MYLMLHIIGMVIGISGYSVYAQEIHQAENTGHDPSTMEHAAFAQSPSVDEQKMKDEWQKAQQQGGAQPHAPHADEHGAQPAAHQETAQPSSADEQKMKEEWQKAQQPVAPVPAAQPHAPHADEHGAQPAVHQEMVRPSSADEQKMHDEWQKAQQQGVSKPEVTQPAASSKPSHPAPTEPQPMAQKESKPRPQVPVIEEIKGIDTVDLEESRGNWLFKRIWWERAEKKYEKIRLLVEKITDSHMEFFEKRTKIDREILDPFKHAMGMEQGELKTLVDQLIAQLQQERDKDGVLNMQERDLLQLLINEKKSVEQLRGYLETITKLDIELDEALKKLLEQINAIRRYERDAWQHFKDIARVLSDTKARELYGNMDVVWQNIKEVEEYLQEPFKEHFDHLMNMITTHVEFINNTVQALKEKGIDLQARLKAQTATGKPQEPQEEDEQEETEESQQGFIGHTLSVIGAGFKTIWDYTVYIVTWPYMKLFGSTESESEYEDEESNEEQGSAQAPEKPEQAEQPDADEQ